MWKSETNHAVTDCNFGGTRKFVLSLDYGGRMPRFQNESPKKKNDSSPVTDDQVWFERSNKTALVDLKRFNSAQGSHTD